ncbi:MULTISPECIES: hypothetical protein [unclassified Nocardioides]|uniref:hypothetical protein n=1 Tax=unclassified Nocardioides TaxID=2615069 RepID=UPI0007031C7C|nr:MULTISPECIES: hypothetical protein [unclassified Nocardioides]KRC54916.1 hypothetical protein ASE19_05535 [Nocardioides sp. Root79]KRC73740.1 hypothetical protein ASE20_03685 [Nocardioides sp. Root240]
MTGPVLTVRDRGGQRVATLSLGGLARRAGIVGAALVVDLAVLSSAPGTPWWPGIVVLTLALVAAEVPDSQAPLLTLAVAAGWWLAAVPWPAPSPGRVLLVALALLVLHATTAVAAIGPPGRVAEARVVRAAAGRAALVGTGTTGIGALALAADGRVVVPGAVGVALLAVAGLAWAATRPTRQ